MLQVDDVVLPARALHAAASIPSPEGFDHVFPAGKITVVLGANRSGKTNLCRLIAGLQSEARGHVSLNGKVLDGLPPRLRPVAMVYQAFVNYPNLTVFDNIASPLRAAKFGTSEMRERVVELATMLRIEALLERLPSELSGGQQQRVAIARAMAKPAQVLLLDEPLVNLDFKLREALESELRTLLEGSDRVVIYTSSDPRDAFNLGDELLVLDNGRKLQAGSTMDVYLEPCSAACMSLLSDPAVNCFERDGVLHALRPEHVELGSGGAGELTFDLRVTACETNGDESFLHGELTVGPGATPRQWVVRQRGMARVDGGQTVKVRARSDDVVRFPDG
jgi:glycerol transport system ATP-binding protein